jgi:2-polyprenyl-6-methoxyphenol hydroxylase-like FAD-dependent oxidoreductase
MIDFWGVGYQVAKRMGIEDLLRAAGYKIEHVRSVDSQGKVKADLGVDAIRGLIGHDFISLPRGDLAEVVYRTVQGKAETVFGDSITAINDHSDGVRVDFERGEPREFDLLVGADGLHSNVRQLAFGDAQGVERYLDCKVAACVVDGYQPRDELVYLTYNTIGRQAGRVALRDDRTMFLFIFRAGRAQETTTPKEQLRREFGDAGWECPRMLDAVDDADDLYFDVVSQIRMDRWWRGRVVLIGDAAGCISLLGGEGTGIAMAEAYVLAGELDRADGDHDQAFRAYDALMHPFVESKQATAARFVGFFATRTRFGLWMRNAVMRAMNCRPVLNLVAGDFRDDLDLPEYAI